MGLEFYFPSFSHALVIGVVDLGDDTYPACFLFVLHNFSTIHSSYNSLYNSSSILQQSIPLLDPLLQPMGHPSRSYRKRQNTTSIQNTNPPSSHRHLYPHPILHVPFTARRQKLQCFHKAPETDAETQDADNYQQKEDIDFCEKALGG